MSYRESCMNATGTVLLTSLYNFRGIEKSDSNSFPFNVFLCFPTFLLVTSIPSN